VESPPEEDKKPASRPPVNLSAEQLRVLLASDFKGGRAARAESRQTSRRQIIWAAAILLAGLFYVVLRFTNAPSKVMLVNTSGEDAASVIVISGNQRVDLGGMANGEVRKVELMPGKPLRVEYTFAQKRVWNDTEPMAAFHALTVYIGIDRKVRVVREAPWSQVSDQPAVQRPKAR
jgi:hypothetical protein